MLIRTGIHDIEIMLKHQRRRQYGSENGTTEKTTKKNLKNPWISYRKQDNSRDRSIASYPGAYSR